MRNTIRNVIIVVLVLMTSCQVSLNLKIGPVMAQTTMMIMAIIKVMGLPAAREAALAVRVNQDWLLCLRLRAMFLLPIAERIRTQPLGSFSNNWFSFQLLY